MTPEETIGSGTEQVYVYFAPSERRLAHLEQRDRWPCKVGYTAGDAPRRIMAQRPATVMAHAPIIGLVIKTNQGRQLECILHLALRERGAAMTDAIGADWFCTSPFEVKALFEGGLRQPCGLYPATPKQANPVIARIIKDAGGPQAIAKASLHTDYPILAKSVYDWPINGVRWHHWQVLIELARTTPDELFEANRVARKRPRAAQERAAA